MDVWEIYGVTKPVSGGEAPPACLGQVWYREASHEESLISAVVEQDGVRVAYVFHAPHLPEAWPPEGAVLVSGPCAPWCP